MDEELTPDISSENHEACREQEREDDRDRLQALDSDN